ncbi:L,D-transpeptidase family protein [Aureimonas sp. SK2]|uniref:L,D-transpeptidase family protein n=1 Tax=Aureimonas sp. SK2 TaxID=3015992 RepID=UPI002444800E|nr:L,D-transpeptidase family protein [Aureimonas sp. SK2]
MGKLWLTTSFLILAAGGTAFAQAMPPEPDLSEVAINAATFADWTARQKATDEDKAATETAATPEAPATDGAEPQADDKPEDDAPDPFLIRVQVLLDRAHASPGVIDGREGGNTDKAIRAFEAIRDIEGDGTIDETLWQALSGDGAPVVKTYQLTREDVDGRYVKEIPSDYGKMAELDHLGYRGPAEMLAERFHMDEDLLRTLNPGADFETEGTTILVADPGAAPEGKVAHIVVDKSKGELFAYDAEDRLLLAAPATIGSDDTPSPSGEMKVNGSAPEPTYEYDPDKNFQQGKNRKKLTIPAGPNGPVGSMWIDLSKPTYGIHGTPEPSQVGKTASHGCVRLTNWDAEALAALVQPARTTVAFKG